ncbi:MAG: 3-oxoacyl-[acyl-carrier-protein] synthase III C-terminal domain-containing protein, partial [Rhodospirillales bacterium]|nr:3-oxoacyl-[acyl-carrier-protein] synthase III C-terminal domain-containing protein [Rhodospirillales bacterium]
PTFRHADTSKSNIIAAALFADGAAGAILTADGSAAETGPEREPTVIGWAEHTWPDTLDVMGWRIEDDGFGVLFSRDIPAIVTERLRAAAEEALSAHGLGLADIDRFVCHLGGSKVVAALEEAFALSPGALDDARAVLRDYGNMSAPSVMFVLERALARERARRIRRPRARPERWLLSALGPGFTASFLILEVP